MKATILIIDDGTGVNEALSIILTRNGFMVDTILSTCPYSPQRNQLPDLYILDIQLKESSGLEICHDIKASPATSRIPVMLISATGDWKDQAREAGANAFLQKPFSKHELTTTITALLNHDTLAFA